MKKILTIGAALAFTSVCSAQWTAISTFEDPADVDKWTVTPNGDNTDPSDLPRIILQDDPLDSGQGTVAALNPGVPTTGGLATSFTIPLPEPWETDESLPIGEPQYYTLFFKVHHANVDGALGKNNSTIGTIDTDNSGQNEFGFYSWPTYNMIFRDGGVGGDNFPEEDNGLPLNSHNGTTYFMPYASATETEADGARMPAADAHADPTVWYNVWMVANMDDLTAEVYVSGGQFGETARLINIIPNYRNGAALDHDTILINTSSDGVNFPHATIIDDVYTTKGKDLNIPSPWTLISNWEDPADVDKWTVTPNGDNTDPTDLPRIILQDDPLNSGQGTVAALNPGVPTTGGLATSFTVPLPWAWETDESLPIGEPQYYTLYYKIHHANVDGALGKNNSTIGTIDTDNSGQNEFGFYSWPTYNMIFRDGGVGGDNFPEEDNGLPLNSHNGTTYFMPYASATETEADGARMPAADAHADPTVWYEVWMVANMDDLTAEVYVSGGQFGETARLINIIPNYRNGAALDHDTILINTSSDGVNFPHATIIDDIQVANGKILSTPGAAAPPPPAWTEISTFEDPADVDKWTVTPNGDNTDPSDLPRIILQPDPLGAGQGTVAALNPGVPTTGGLATSFTIPLPEPWVTDESLPIGEPQYHTLFFKVHHANVDGALGKNNSTIGTIDTDNSSQNEFGFYSWPTYNMIFRDGGVGGDNFPEEDNGLPLNSHNGTTYFMPYASENETDPDGARMPAADAHADPTVWYNVWMVANMDDLTAEVYVSGGQFGESARLINIIPNYRNGAALDHDTILINTSSDGVNFPHATIIDDVFTITGKVLSVPSTDPVADTRPRAVGEDAGSTTITLTAESVSDAEVGDTVFDGETALGVIASIDGQVITLDAPLAAALAADTLLTFEVVVVDDTPRAEETASGSTTIATSGVLPAEAVAGNLVFLDDGTELGKIASVAGNVITLESALAVAIPADSELTFVEDNTPDSTLGQLVNLSTRSQVGTGDDVLIGGFVIGKDSQQVLIQATGPELTGVAGILADPYLVVTNTTGGVNTVVGENDDWESDQGQLISDLWGGNPPLAAGSKSSAVVVTLAPGTYTATISGVGDTTGVALIEVYEID